MPHLKIERLTHTNKQIMKNTALSEFEDFWFIGANNDKIHGWLVRLFEFNANQRYPVVLLIHGNYYYHYYCYLMITY
jgi:dipeptidyl aminopeptidase/acylaminoacyl peptidase